MSLSSSGSYPASSGWGGEPRPSAQSVYFKAQCHQLLSAALEKARTGGLSANWRSELTPGPAPALYQDVTELAVRELLEMPAALWEPGQAQGNWRAALDAWYAASRIVVSTAFIDTARGHLNLLETSERALGALLSSAMAPPDRANPEPTDVRNQFITGEHTDQLDRLRVEQSRNYVAQRDWLTASYFAGLAAGGVQAPNWREWLRDRAKEWSNPLMVRRVEIETSSLAHHFERLPDYWLA